MLWDSAAQVSAWKQPRAGPPGPCVGEAHLLVLRALAWGTGIWFDTHLGACWGTLWGQRLSVPSLHSLSAFLHLGRAIFLSFPFLLSFPPSLPHPLLCSSQYPLFLLKTKQQQKNCRLFSFCFSFFLVFFRLFSRAPVLLHSPSASFELVGTIFVLSLCCTPEHQYVPDVSFYSISCPCFTSGARFLWLLPFFTVCRWKVRGMRVFWGTWRHTCYGKVSEMVAAHGTKGEDKGLSG